MKDAWDASADEPDLGRRLLAALQAGDRAGGDRRGPPVRRAAGGPRGAGYAGLDDVAVDLRVDDHPDPCGELGPAPRAQPALPHRVHRAGAGAARRRAPRPSWRNGPARLGQPDLAAWVGSENYEMRVGLGGRNGDRGDDAGWVDVLVLQALRDATG